MSTSKHTEQGFTLVELAIVLVIIGLIIGGVLVGQDMIKSAEIRATVGQWESFSAASNTFRDKYRYIPGDINATLAAQIGLVARSGAVGHGDGNGLLEGCSAGAIVAGCENVLFWRDLNTMSLVDGWFQTATDALGIAATAQQADDIPLSFPEADLGRGNFWLLFAAQGKNWYQIAGITDISNAGVYTLTNALTPFEAFNIDRKMDDSRPLVGSARAMESLTTPNTLAVAGAATCVFTDSTYNQTTEALTNTPLCQLRLRF